MTNLTGCEIRYPFGPDGRVTVDTLDPLHLDVIPC